MIKAAAFNGSVVANDSSLLIDGNTGKFNLSGSVGTDIIPDTDVAYDLGNATYRFRDLYLSGSSIKLGAATITATGTAVNLPAGSTIGGSAIGIPGGDLNVNIVADDSTVIVNTTTEVVTAQGGFVGNVTGNATSVTNGIYTTDTATVTNTMLAGSIADTKLSTISTAGKVSNSATTATSNNVVNAIVSRNSSGDFFANTVFANVEGDITGSVFADNSSQVIDGTSGHIVGTINNAITTSQTIYGATIELSGVNNSGVRAGIQIDTDGTGEDAYSLFAISGRNNSQFGQSIVFERGRGTHAVPAALQNGDDVSELVWLGLNNVATTKLLAAIRVSVSGAVTANVPGKIAIGTVDAGSGDFKSGLSIDSIQMLDVANNTVAANSGSGTANVSGGVVSYLKIKVEGVERAIPLYGIVP